MNNSELTSCTFPKDIVENFLKQVDALWYNANDNKINFKSKKENQNE